MSLQNRVRPDGTLVAETARGTLFGNRGGRFHDPRTRTLSRRRWVSKRWIVCVLDFKGRHREVWGTGYTELFFLDEVTAIAAGHRPCAECRRRAARDFQAAAARGLAAPDIPALAAIDARLHAERRATERPLRRVAALPEGAVIARGGEFLALRGGRLLPWGPSGYGPARPVEAGARAAVVTPTLSLAALAGGYRPLWHESAHA